jgi:hypothetical protein
VISWFAQNLFFQLVYRSLHFGANVINISRQTARIIVATVRVRYDDAGNIPIMTQEIGTVGGCLYKPNPVVTHSLKPPGFNPCAYSAYKV